jgi:hypothetical protein
MPALMDALDHPEKADISILDKLNTAKSSSQSFEQMQTVRGLFTALGIIGVLVVLALILQQFHIGK